MADQNLLSLPSLISDHAVLQHGVALPIRGQSRPRQRIHVSLAGQTRETEAGEDGRWVAQFDPFQPGGPHTLHVSPLDKPDDPKARLEVRDLYFGDVWLCSGQSKMEWPVRKSTVGEELMEQADCPKIRHFIVPKIARDRPVDQIDGRWQVCSPETVSGFSAVALEFGREIQQNAGVPIGLIQAAWRETQVASWTPPEALRSSVGQEVAPRYSPLIPISKTEIRKPSQFYFDPGNKGLEHGWADPTFAAADWRLMLLPNYWQHFGMYFNGSLWFRKDLEIPKRWKGRTLRLSLGCIDDFDVTYFNGEEIGRSEENYYETHRFLRKYEIPPDLIRPQNNVIAVRVFDHFGFGGFSGPASAMKIHPSDEEEDAISLVGRWKCAVEHMMLPWLIGQPQEAPSSLYHGMICPLTWFPLKGITWYQGERDVTHAQRYGMLFKAMIKGWREQWRLGDVPFLFVQLANYHESHAEPVDDEWAELREAEAAALSLPNTAMAVSLNVEEDPLKPVTAKTVGHRLALAARAKVYGQDVAHSGPVLDHHRIEQNRIRLHFHHTHGGLHPHGGGRLKGFALAGRDRVFHWAEARIEGDCVVVSSNAVPEPVAVRYAWDANPVCNLMNGENLPASPFRTDHWPGITDGVV
jgi:sialate O-acetylesterase